MRGQKTVKFSWRERGPKLCHWQYLKQQYLGSQTSERYKQDMESYQETVLSAIKLSFFLIENEIGEFPVGAHLLFFLVSYLESLLITA